MSKNKAEQPNWTAPPVTPWNAKQSVPQPTDTKRSRQQINQIQQHLLFDVCEETQLAVHAVCSPLTYQGTWAILKDLAGCINAATGQTFIGSITLAQRIGVDRDTTDAQLKRLQESGIVQIHGKVGRGYIRSITLPCNHLDIDAESSAESSADTCAESSAETYAESSADTCAETLPHYQNITGTEQQQINVGVGVSLAQRQAIVSAINDKLPLGKQIKLTKAINGLIDSWHDNSTDSDQIIAQLHTEQAKWNTSGGTVTALERITDTWAATYQEWQPALDLVACTGLADNIVCDCAWHTTIGDRDAPVQHCPQRKRPN